MLTDGINHVAIVTPDAARLHAFYRDVFDAEVGEHVEDGPGLRLTMVHIGPHTELNVFEIPTGSSARCW